MFENVLLRLTHVALHLSAAMFCSATAMISCMPYVGLVIVQYHSSMNVSLRSSVRRETLAQFHTFGSLASDHEMRDEGPGFFVLMPKLAYAKAEHLVREVDTFALNEL